MINDGQHRHRVTPEYTTLTVDFDGMKFLADHVTSGECTGKFTAESEIPVSFLLDNDDEKTATVICGLCQKRLGKCVVCSEKKK